MTWGLTLVPPALMNSLVRPVIESRPSADTLPTSPG